MKKKGNEKSPNQERWLLTYSDLITLLMIFFVVMYASSTIDSNKYKAIANSFSTAMGGGKNVIDFGNDPTSSDDLKVNNASIDTNASNNSTNNTNSNNNAASNDTTAMDSTKVTEASEQEKLQEIKAEVDRYLESNGLNSSVTSNISERGLIISLKDSAFFDSGQATLRKEYENKLISISQIVNKLDNYIRVEGHTDNVPIHNENFNSNWELSVIRATTVVELTINKAGIPPSKISAVGYGEYRPIADNNTEEGRAQNRRVDIVILSNKFSGGEEKASK